MTERTEALLAELVELQRRTIANQERAIEHQAQAIKVQDEAVVRQKQAMRLIRVLTGLFLLVLGGWILLAWVARLSR